MGLVSLLPRIIRLFKIPTQKPKVRSQDRMFHLHYDNTKSAQFLGCHLSLVHKDSLPPPCKLTFGAPGAPSYCKSLSNYSVFPRQVPFTLNLENHDMDSRSLIS